MIDIKKRIKVCDILAIFITFFAFLVRAMTNFYMSYMSKLTGAEISSVIEVLEINPFAKLLLLMGNFSMILQMILIPSMVLALYIILRKQVLNGRLDILILEFFCFLLFFVMLHDVLNDAVILIGRLMNQNVI